MTQAERVEWVVADYINRRRQAAARELAAFASLPTFEEAVSRAALAQRSDGKRHSHQFRTKADVLEQARLKLLAVTADLKEVRSFDRLHAAVRRAIGRISGIGDLSIYDAALKIGAWLRLEPTVVYLHRGTREGASRLGLDVTLGFVPVDRLPKPFAALSPREIEDVLCIYKRHLGHDDDGAPPPISCALPHDPSTPAS